MRSKVIARAASVGLIMALASCGGGGGSPAPAPPPAPPPADTTPPDTTLGGGPQALTNQRDASFTFTSTEANSAFEVSLDGAAYVAATTPYGLSNLADGAHTLSVRARDVADNVDASPATFGWTVDATAPTVRVLFPGTHAYTDHSSIQLRGTAADAGTIDSLTINGTAATTSDAFRNWTATVAVVTGENTYTIAVSDAAGNTNAGAASVSIANRGRVISSINSIVLDSARNRLLISDWTRSDILAVRLSDGVVSVFSGVSSGLNPIIERPSSLCVDAVNDRLLAFNPSSQAIFAYDLDTGQLGENALASISLGQSAYGQMTYDPADDVAYIAGGGVRKAIIRVDISNGAADQITSNSIGTGDAFVQPVGVEIDSTSAGGGNRLFVADVGSIPGEDESRIFLVDVATGDRTVLSTSATPAVGTGPTMRGIGSMSLDAANNRLLVSVYSGTEQARLLAIDLANGNRSVVAATDAISASAQFAFDPASGGGFLAHGDRSRLLRLDATTQQFVRFSDSTVGTGPTAVLYNSLALDTAGDTPTLISGAQLSGTSVVGGVIRINPATGTRSSITGGGLGSGPPLYIANSVQLDTRAGMPANQLLAYDPGTLPSGLVSIDMANGNRSIASLPGLNFWSAFIMTLDATAGRMIGAVRSSFNDDYTLAGIDVASGAITPISSPSGPGSGPEFSPTWGSITAIGVDAPASGAKRYLVAASDGHLTAVDAANGDRTLLWPHNAGIDFTPYDLHVDSAARRAYVISNYGVLRALDLTNNEMTLISGLDETIPQSVRGTGPTMYGLSLKVRVNPAAGVAYVVANSDSIMAVDMTNGQRAIVSR